MKKPQMISEECRSRIAALPLRKLVVACDRHSKQIAAKKKPRLHRALYDLCINAASVHLAKLYKEQT